MNITAESPGADAIALNRAGIVCLQRGQKRRAVALFIQACRIEPASGVWWNNLSYALYRIGKLDEAIKTLERALKADGTQKRKGSGLSSCILK